MQGGTVSGKRSTPEIAAAPALSSKRHSERVQQGRELSNAVPEGLQPVAAKDPRPSATGPGLSGTQLDHSGCSLSLDRTPATGMVLQPREAAGMQHPDAGCVTWPAPALLLYSPPHKPDTICAQCFSTLRADQAVAPERNNGSLYFLVTVITDLTNPSLVRCRSLYVMPDAPSGHCHDRATAYTRWRAWWHAPSDTEAP